MKVSSLIYFLLCPLFLFGHMDLGSMPMGPVSLKIENRILAKVRDNTISVLDVKKKMDLIFFKSYPHLIENDLARYQFYQAHWEKTLEDMIDTELMIADSEQKDLKVTDGEIHEEIHNRFGPNIVKTLDQIGITHQEAYKMIKEEMIVQRMMWFFVYQKASQQVHPSDIKLAYKNLLKESPPKELWTYRVVTIRGDESNTLSENLYQELLASHKNLQELPELFRDRKEVSLSPEYTVEDKDLSDQHKKVLENLKIGECSKPILQKSRRDGVLLYRIFELQNHTQEEATPFVNMYDDLKNKLFYQEADKLSQGYLDKLKAFYGYEKILEELPSDFQPFIIQ